MISLLVTLLVILLVFGVLLYVIRLLPLEEPFGRIAQVVLLVILVLVLIGYLLPFAGVRLP